MKISNEEFKILKENNVIIDCSNGGLVLGNSHEKGGINLIRKNKIENNYSIILELEGWEYIISPKATYYKREHLRKINSEFQNTNLKFLEYEIPEDTMIIDARPIDKNDLTSGKLLLIDEYEQWIINKHSTKKHLTELNYINSTIK